MNLVTWIVIAGAVVAFLLLKRLTLVTPATAREWLNKGALVIDVRSEGEFQERHLPSAINIPLGRLGDEITRRAPDKEQAILLHCLSGTRSGMAKTMLKKRGYRNVFNLGSYGRAEKFVGQQSQSGKQD
jgi:rhodanese-related sulfurtransferase